MATYNLFLNASQANNAITNAYRLFQPDGLTGENISLYGGNINHWGAISSTQLNITGDVGEESFINRLTGGIRVQGDCEFDRILGGVEIYGVSYIQSLTGGLNVTNGGINIIGSSSNNGSFSNVGSVSINGSTTITGSTRIVGNTEVRGNFYQSGLFDVISSDAEFRGNVDITGSLDVYGPLNINGNTVITATNGLTLSGPATINGNSTLNGTTNIVGELLLNGEPFITQTIYETTEVNYFLTGGECVEAITGGGGGVIQLDNLALRANNEGVANGVAGTTFGTILPGLAMRGSGAVDLQMFRNSNVQIASGRASAILAGESNMASGIRSAVIAGIANTGIGSHSIVVGGERNRTLKNYSITLGGSFAKTYNTCEVVQGSQGVQRGSMIGFYNSGASDLATRWGYDGASFSNSGLFIPQQTTFIKFRACKIDPYQPCNVSEKEFGIAAFYSSNTVVVTQGNSQGFRIALGEGANDEYSNKLLTIKPTGTFDGYVTITADIVYTSVSETCATTTNEPIAFNSDPDLDILFS